MFDADRQLFCDRLVHTGTTMSRQGVSERYTAMTLLGLHRYEKAGFHSPFEVRTIADALMRRPSWAENPGDAGLLIWTCAEIIPECLDEYVRENDPASGLLGSADARMRSTMELAWFLTGLAKGALVDSAQRSRWEPAARTAYELLKKNQGPFGFFGHRAAGLGPRTWRGRIGSFADQVYPIYALTMFAKAFGVGEALESAIACAGAICNAQGPLGQWWWHYDSSSGRVVQRYPVYSVHQEGMAPMALLAVGEATGRDFGQPIMNGLEWIFGRNELNHDMRDLQVGVVWRSLRFATKARMLQQEIRGWNRPGSEPVNAKDLSVLHECRPYELGWLLYALSAERKPAGNSS
jgi:hypothetical protein